jgi:ribosomal protein S18 acetylase RimI-like enzyme
LRYSCKEEARFSMQDPIRHIDPVAMPAQIEANVNAYLLSFGRLPGAVLHHDGETKWVDSGLDDPSLNSVVSARLSIDTVGEGVVSVIRYFQQVARPFTWHIGPTTVPADLDTVLLAWELQHLESEPGMAAELDRLEIETALTEALSVETVADARGLKEWVAVCLDPEPEAAKQRRFTALSHGGVGDDTCRYYLGRVQGAPVACSQLFIAEGLATVHYVTTLSEYRRRGFGTAMTMQVLRDARDLGCHIAVLTASHDGAGVYRRLGFAQYGLFRRYQWFPPRVR